MKKVFLLAASLLCWTQASHAQMTEEDALDARATRLAVFQLLSMNMEPIAGMARGTVPFDAVIAERNARRVMALSLMIPEVFTPDTRGVMIYTRAKDFIWDNWGTFEELATELNRTATVMADAAASGDQAALTRAMRATGPACGKCHDLFRFQESDPALPVPKPD